MQNKVKYKYTYPNSLSKYYKLKRRWKILGFNYWQTVFKSEFYQELVDYKKKLGIK